MKIRSRFAASYLLAVILPLALAVALVAQTPPEFTSIQRLTNNEVLLKLSAPAGQNFRLEVSTDLGQWLLLATFRSTGQYQATDSAAPFLDARFYRAFQLPAPSALVGDHLATADGDVILQPLNHATFVMSWNGKMIYNDPVGGAGRFTGLPRADLILVSHIHGDHFEAATINAVKGTNAIIIAPAEVYQGLSAALKGITTVLINGATTNVLGLTIDAVPAYNSRHPKGAGNGYVLTIGGKRIYMSGDTEDIVEMRALQNIDVAFLCMNLPFTMSADKAASAVREFKPKVIYPYHFSDNSNATRFKQLVGVDLGIEVRLRKWY